LLPAWLIFVFHFGFRSRQFRSDNCGYLRGIDLVPNRRARKVRVSPEGLRRFVDGAIQVRNEGADHEETMKVCGFHGLHGSGRNLLVLHGLSTP